MSRWIRVIFALNVTVLTWAICVQAANHVRVESRTIPKNDRDTIGVYFTNDVPIAGAIVPLELRSVTPGCFIVDSSVQRVYNTAGRLHNSALGAANPNGANASITQGFYPLPAAGTGCSGGTNKWQTTAAKSDLISPDALLLAAISTADPSFEDAELLPGTDPDGTPSYRIIFTTNTTPGTFEIDTCCVQPANTLIYLDINAAVIPVTFQKGVITIDPIADVKELETGIIPQDYSLEQNYPNPFNAGTVIRFAQPVDGNVRVDVFNILGRKVKTLVNEFRVAGTHQTDWDGRSDDGVEVATGVYFYRITTDAFSSTRKMVLLK